MKILGLEVKDYLYAIAIPLIITILLSSIGAYYEVKGLYEEADSIMFPFFIIFITILPLYVGIYIAKKGGGLINSLLSGAVYGFLSAQIGGVFGILLGYSYDNISAILMSILFYVIGGCIFALLGNILGKIIDNLKKYGLKISLIIWPLIIFYAILILTIYIEIKGEESLLDMLTNPFSVLIFLRPTILLVCLGIPIISLLYIGWSGILKHKGTLKDVSITSLMFGLVLWTTLILPLVIMGGIFFFVAMIAIGGSEVSAGVFYMALIFTTIGTFIAILITLISTLIICPLLSILGGYIAMNIRNTPKKFINNIKND